MATGGTVRLAAHPVLLIAQRATAGVIRRVIKGRSIAREPLTLFLSPPDGERVAKGRVRGGAHSDDHRRQPSSFVRIKSDLRGRALACVAALVTQAAGVCAQTASPWRAFQQRDGLAEGACASVTLGSGGHVLVRHPNSDAVSLLDGYEITTVAGPAGSRERIHESPGGQLWTLARDGLLEFRDGEWLLHRVPEIALHSRRGETNPVPLLPVRQGRVLILFREQLLQFSTDDPERGPTETLRNAAQTELGEFTGMWPARDGGLWITGTNAFAKTAGPLRNLKPDAAWVTTADAPAELKPVPSDLLLREEFSNRRILDTALEPDGALWVATSDGLFRQSPAIWESADRQSPDRPGPTLATTVRADPETDAPSVVPDELAPRAEWTARLVARNGDLWLGGANEIAWRRKNAWRVFTSTNQIGPEGVLAFVEAPDGRICCATPDKVWEFDGRNWLMLRGGFSHINALCCARDGTLWVATDEGLHRGTRGAWLQNDVADGLPSAVVTGVHETESGAIVSITAAGASVFQPDADPDPPRTRVQPLAGREPAVREGAMVRLVFGARDKWNVTAPERLLFSHRLDEREWSPFQPSTEANFADLSVGKHYFQVRAMDRNANVDPRPARLEFMVIEPWYRETRLVLVLAVALAVALFFAGLAFNRHRRLRLSYTEVERQVAERTRELEVANRELVHSQKMHALGTLSAGIAHDFNNILSIIKGSAQIIEDNPGNPEKIRTRVARIKTVVQQGAGIVEAMLGFSRGSEHGAAPCHVNGVVDETIKLLGDRFTREVEVRFERGGDLPEIPVARDFVQQVLLNLIFNAAEAMERRDPMAQAPRRKRIIITTRETDAPPGGIVLQPSRAAGYIAISVRDFGSGIAPENLPRIFEPFFTTKAMSARRGTGLGLSMVYELAKKLEAGLAVESEVGAGSTFTILLPVKTVPAREVETENVASL